MKYLFEISENYCDEFDVAGFSILTEEDYKTYEYIKENINKLNKDDEPFYIGFGSNEEIEFENAGEFINSLNITEISDEEYEIINKHFGKHYGLISIQDEFDYLCDELQEELDK